MAKNKRCPLQEECERKCSYQGHELDCDYYHINARKDYYIEDQEEIRREIERKAEEEYWARRLAEKSKEDEEEYEPEEYEDKPTPEVTYLDGPMGVTEKIKKAMYETAKQFVYIGFLLWEVQEYGYYSEKGYADVYEYAETELGFKRSSTKNFIAINVKFGSREVKDGWNMIQQRTMFLQPKYEKFSYSQLCEMLSMSPAKRDTITPDMTIKQIREIKRQSEPDLPPNMETIPIPLPEDQAAGQTSGQKKNFIKIKPCPFCGGKAKTARYTEQTGYEGSVTWSYILCEACRANGPKYDDREQVTQKEATDILIALQIKHRQIRPNK